MKQRKICVLAGLSLSLGLSQLIAPHVVARLAGVPDATAARMMVRAVGLRQLLSGVGLLSSHNSIPWVWARLGGDLIDLVLLGTTMGSPGARRGPLMIALIAIGGVMALDLRWGERLSIEHEGLLEGRMLRPSLVPHPEHRLRETSPRSTYDNA